MRCRAGSLGEHEQVRAALALPLNFLQHIFTILKQHGRAEVVLPDNVLSSAGRSAILSLNSAYEQRGHAKSLNLKSLNRGL